jgi:pantoate--beta-alanine ligase
MEVIQSSKAMQNRSTLWLRQGVRIGFVPTMGYLHKGHLSLVRRARRAVGFTGKVVVSIYVNPTQFGPNEDFSRYPRDFNSDRALCKQAGVDVIFAPSDREMYYKDSPTPFSTYVNEEKLSKVMEGVTRPGHFKGVTTIVAKLFNIVRPDVAVFGAKDWQQAAIIRRMVRDLNFPLKLIVSPTLRESDGLAMSSRNKYLEGSLRQQARVLSEVIGLAKSELRKRPGVTISADKLRRQCEKVILQAPDARIDYVSFFDSDTLESVEKVRKGTHMALAVFIGRTRLIDNSVL